MTASPLERRAVFALGLTGLLLLASAGCKKTDDKVATDNPEDPQSIAEDGTDTVAAESDAEVVTSSLVSATASSGSLTLASMSELGGGSVDTAGVGDGAKALYFPRNCLTVTSNEAAKTVTYAFADCTGPNGIFKITGTIVAAYAVAPGKLTLNLVGTDLRVNRATVDWTATSEITSDGVARSMHWSGTLSGVTVRGKTFARTTEKVVTWRFGERCFGVNGVSEGKVRDRYLKTEVVDFRRCQGSCPEAGGRITISNADKVKVELTFDGTSKATFTTAKGQSTIDLACSG